MERTGAREFVAAEATPPPPHVETPHRTKHSGLVSPCESCNRVEYTRVVLDRDGTELRLCESCPSPVDVFERTAEIRAEWKTRAWERQRTQDERQASVCTVTPVIHGGRCIGYSLREE